MFKEVSQHLYAYIMQAEMIFLDVYKVDPWQIMSHMTMLDLQIYMKKIEKEWKEKQEKFKKKDIMEALRKVNEILTWVFYKK